MWDSPRDLNALANLIFALVTVFASLAAINWIVRLPAFQLKTVRIEGVTDHLSRDQVTFIVGRMKGDFFTIDLDRVRSDFEKLPWVRNVSVRRSWPLRIEVKLEEHVALARWGADQLVDTYGDVFDASTDRKLPHFSGPFGSSNEVAAEYSAFSRSLVPVDRHIDEVSLSERRSWELKLDDGMVIELGRTRMEQRLARFAALYGRT
ncbi:MAG TPA: cell division protein FtsQ/DivIB, partial [Burkholderiales bacterium]|nr:cell division protein FtsQ/DivIB [Burkholderiales bacterium]